MASGTSLCVQVWQDEAALMTQSGAEGVQGEDLGNLKVRVSLDKEKEEEGEACWEPMQPSTYPAFDILKHSSPHGTGATAM